MTHAVARKYSQVGGTPGWRRVQYETPDPIADAWKGVVDEIPLPKQGKLVGTAAIALFAALPENVRYRLWKWARDHEATPESFDKRDALAVMMNAMMSEGQPIEGDEERRLIRVALPPVELPDGSIEERFEPYFISSHDNPRRGEVLEPKNDSENVNGCQSQAG